MSENPAQKQGPTDEVKSDPDITMRMSKMPSAAYSVEVEPVREIAPVIFFDELPDDAPDKLFDFRPVNEIDSEAPVVVPKVLFAQESVDFSDVIPESESETPVPVEKDNGQPKESESGTPTSSPTTSPGKNAQPA